MDEYLIRGGGALLLLASPAQAIIINGGITYELQTQATADPLTNRFALVISGENSASDPIGGRTGITGFSLNEDRVELCGRQCRTGWLCRQPVEFLLF